MEPSSESSLPCAEKMTFDSQKQAEATATTVGWQRGSKVKAYKCQHCELWHLSSN